MGDLLALRQRIRSVSDAMPSAQNFLHQSLERLCQKSAGTVADAIFQKFLHLERIASGTVFRQNRSFSHGVSSRGTGDGPAILMAGRSGAGIIHRSVAIFINCRLNTAWMLCYLIALPVPPACHAQAILVMRRGIFIRLKTRERRTIIQYLLKGPGQEDNLF